MGIRDEAGGYREGRFEGGIVLEVPGVRRPNWVRFAEVDGLEIGLF